MIGAIIGDIVGSVYEGSPIRTRHFPLFGTHAGYTDDSVLTVATAWSILHGVDYRTAYRRFGRKYTAGYGASFYRWLHAADDGPYNSWGNGSAMRVSPVGFAFDRIDDVLDQARKSAAVTHDHPEGIKGAQATALAVYWARTGKTKGFIREDVGKRFGYDLDRSLDEIRPAYRFEISCQKSVPESIIAFLESDSVEAAVRNAVSLGGDADTMACIAGGIAQAFYRRIPREIVEEARSRMPAEFTGIVDAFNRRFGIETEDAAG